MNSSSEEIDSKELDELYTAAKRIEEGEGLEDVLENLEDLDAEINNLRESSDSEIGELADFLTDVKKAVEVKEIASNCLSTPTLELPMVLVGIREMLCSSDFPVDRSYILDKGFRRREWFVKVRKSAPGLTLQIISKWWEVGSPKAITEELGGLPILSPNVSWETNEDSKKVAGILKWGKLVERLTKREIIVLASFWFVDFIKKEKNVNYPKSIIFLEDSLWKILEEKYGKNGTNSLMKLKRK